jgi:branched-chain amino acid transport system ATP-binding protein
MSVNPEKSTDVLLEARQLSASHGQLVAVREVSLQLRAGETVALVGSNGAGKTTLMRTLAGVHPVHGGSIWLGGDEVSARPAHQRVQQGLALVPEGRRLFADMTVRENLQLAQEHRGRLRDGGAGWTIERVVQALPALQPLMNRPAGALSGGQRQAAAIARALMTNPRVLLIDEVSLGLSPRAVDEVYQHLHDLRREAGTTLLLVEQDLGRAMAFADRVLCLREGRIVLAAAAAGLDRQLVTDAYFGVEHTT